MKALLSDIRMYIIFLGAPGAGKGTQAINIARELNAVHIASGDLFRQSLEKETELGEKAKFFMDKGILVPDEVTIQMVLERMSSFDIEDGVILDGFPRTLRQAEVLDEALAKKNCSIDKVIYIKVSEEELMHRLSGRWICRNCQVSYNSSDSFIGVRGCCDKCGGELFQRTDDTDKTLAKRLQTYFSETVPLVDYYSRVDKLVEIDGEGSVDEVSKRIMTAVKVNSS